MNLSPDLHALTRLANLTNLAHIQAQQTLILGLEAGATEGALNLLLATVYRSITLGADIKRIKLIVVELVLVMWILVTSLGLNENDLNENKSVEIKRAEPTFPHL